MHQQVRGLPGAIMPQVMTADDLRRAIRRIAHEILERHHGAENVVLVGIHSRGVPLAQELAAAIKGLENLEVPTGKLDVGMYRDDLDVRPTTRLNATDIPVDITDRQVVLVDDVLFTGRTVRAALDALLDMGRPDRVELAVLVDRGHRQLPIRPDYIGKNIPTSLSQRVSLKLDSVDGTAGVWLDEIPGEAE